MTDVSASPPEAALRGVVDSLAGCLRLDPSGGVEVRDEARLRGPAIGQLVKQAALAQEAGTRQACRWLIRASAQATGVYPASTRELYLARGRGEVAGFTVPAINARMLPYDSAWAAFAVARELGVGALIFEMARSEMGYTWQSPDEFACMVLAAAVKSGFQGPVFIQGDHFQVNRQRFRTNPGGELSAIRQLIQEAIAAGFYNIDIDASTVVDTTQTDPRREQEPNCRIAAELTEYIGRLQPPGIVISVGGEIGEVGGRNSTLSDLHAFMDGYLQQVSRDAPRITKISVQTGTHHGGVVLADGAIASVAVSFETLQELGRAARERYGMAGVVQHGASTLPEGMFHRFPEVETAEIHMATEFQNIIFDSAEFPPALRSAMYEYLSWEFGGLGEGATEAQFFYRERKRALGPFKPQLWALPEEVRASLRRRLEEKFRLIFRELRVVGTEGVVGRYVKPVPVALPMPGAPANTVIG